MPIAPRFAALQNTPPNSRRWRFGSLCSFFFGEKKRFSGKNGLGGKDNRFGAAQNFCLEILTQKHKSAKGWPAASLCLLLAACLASGCTKEGAAPDEVFLRYFGGQGDQSAADLIERRDAAGFALLGSSDAFGTLRSPYLVLTGSDGGEANAKFFAGAEPSEGISLRQAANGDFALLTEVEYDGGQQKIRLLRTGSDLVGETGLILRSALNSNEYGSAVWADNDYAIVVGTTDAVDPGKPNFNAATDLSDLYLARVSAAGDLIWESVYGFPEQDTALAVLQDGDDFLVFGATYRNGAPWLWVVRFNANGEVIGQFAYENSAGLMPAAFTPLDNGSYAFIGLFANGEVGLALLDGVRLQDEPQLSRYTWNGLSLASIQGFAQLDAGGWVACGTTAATQNQGTQIALFKIDPAGTPGWFRTFGGIYNDAGGPVLALPDALIFSGTVDIATRPMITLVKTNPEGLLE